MNLCLYTATFLPTIGGAELVLHALASALAVQGHSVTVLAPFVRRADNRVEAPYRLRRYQRPSSKRFGVRQILLYLLHEYWRRPFDVLHCHGAYPPAYVGATLKRLLNIPMVVRPHGSDILPGEFIRAHVKLERRLTRALAAADLIIAQSQFLKHELLSLGVPEGRIRLIPNGVHVAEFQPVRSAPPLPYPYILAMGSFSPKKGFDVLLRAFTLVAAADPSIHLVLAGAGKELTAYTALVGEHDMLGRVHFVGIVEGWSRYSSISIACFSSAPRVENPSPQSIWRRWRPVNRSWRPPWVVIWKSSAREGMGFSSHLMILRPWRRVC